MLLSIFLSLFLNVSTAKGPAVPDDCEFLRQQLKALPAEGGQIDLPAGTFTCRRPVIIDRDNVEVRGQGQRLTVFRLAANTHAPLMIIGNEHTMIDANGNYVTVFRVSNIKISDFSLDGNRANQDTAKECGAGECEGDAYAVRNNGLTIRGASHVTVERISSYASISGGLVTEKFCDHLTVRDFTASDNFFDGFAGYETVASEFSNLHLHGNKGAGISIDINFNQNIFRDSLIEDSGDVGVFGRHIHGVVFRDVRILRSGNHGVFLAKSGAPNSCAENTEFDRVQVQYSSKAGIRLNDDCPGNVIRSSSNLCFNQEGAVSQPWIGELRVEAGAACADATDVRVF